MLIIVLIIVVIGSIWLYNVWKKQAGEGEKNNALLRDFENRMKERGFTKRIVVYDFFKEFAKSFFKGNQYWWTVGIWLDYQKEMMALRLDRDDWKEIDIPFDKIQSVEIIEDGFEQSTGKSAVFGANTATTHEMRNGLQVRIAAGDGTTGVNAYFLNLWIARAGAKLQKNDENYKAIKECARSIVDEISIIKPKGGNTYNFGNSNTFNSPIGDNAQQTNY